MTQARPIRINLIAIILLGCAGGDLSRPTQPSAPVAAPPPGPATQLAWIARPPASAALGQPIQTAPSVQLRDAQGRTVQRAGVVVTASWSGACGRGEGLSATTDANGRALFAALTLRGAAMSRVLRVGSEGISGVESDSVRFVWGSAVAGDTVSVRCFGANGAGVSDEAPAIQRALESVSDDGAVVTMEAGTYLLGTSAGGVELFPNGAPVENALIVRHQNVVLLGQGTKTVLQLMAHRKMRIVAVVAPNVRLEALVADGNKVARDGSVPWPGGDIVDAMLYATHTHDVTFRRVEARNGIEDGVATWIVTRTIVDSCYSHDNGTPFTGGAGVALSNGVDGVATNNRLERNTIGIWASHGNRGIEIRGNYIAFSQDAGLALGGQAENSNYLVSDNTVEENGQRAFGGIVVNGVVTGSLLRNKVLNNKGAGVFIGNSSTAPSIGWIVADNTIANTDARRPQANGVEVGGTSVIMLRNNRIQNNGNWIGNAVVVQPGGRIENQSWLDENVISYTPPI